MGFWALKDRSGLLELFWATFQIILTFGRHFFSWSDILFPAIAYENRARGTAVAGLDFFV